MPIYNLSEVVQVQVGRKSYYEVIQEYLPEWCSQRECHINSISRRVTSPLACMNITLSTAWVAQWLRHFQLTSSHIYMHFLEFFTTPMWTIQSIMRGVVLTGWYVPCTEPIMTAILANLWRLDCQITKNVYFSLRCSLLSAIPKITWSYWSSSYRSELHLNVLRCWEHFIDMFQDHRNSKRTSPPLILGLWVEKLP